MPTFLEGWGAAQNWVSDIRPRTKTWAHSVASRIKELKLERGKIGMDGLAGPLDPDGWLPHDVYKQLIALLPDASIGGLDDMLEKVRAIKSAEELGVLRKAAALGDLMLATCRDVARPGVKECEVYGAMAQAMMANGGEEPTLRLVEPYTIERELPFWRVHTWDRTADGPRTYRLDRMRSARMTRERFDPRESFDPNYLSEPAVALLLHAPSIARWKLERGAHEYPPNVCRNIRRPRFRPRPSEPAYLQAGVSDDTSLLGRCIREMGMRRRALSLLVVGSAVVCMTGAVFAADVMVAPIGRPVRGVGDEP
jgi:hypothetical protein